MKSLTKKLILGATGLTGAGIVGMAVGISLKVSYAGVIEQPEKNLTYWGENKEFRKELVGTEIKSFEAEHVYTAPEFKKTFGDAQDGATYRSISSDPLIGRLGHDLSDSNFITVDEHNIQQLSQAMSGYPIKIGDQIPMGQTYVYGLAANVANIYEKANKDKVMGWNVSKVFKSDWGKNTDKTKAIVFEHGGPVADLTKSISHWAFDAFNPFGNVIIANQAQFGVDPLKLLLDSVKLDENNQFKSSWIIDYLSSSANCFAQNFNGIFKNELIPNLVFTKLHENDSYLSDADKPKLISEEEALNVILGGLYSKRQAVLNQIANYIYSRNSASTIASWAYSMAWSKIDADRSAQLAKILKPSYKDGVYLTGKSHGYYAVIDSILYNEENIELWNGFDAEANSLRESFTIAPDGQKNIQSVGGIITANDQNNYVGTKNVNINQDIAMLRNKIKFDFGYINVLEDKFKNQDWLSKFQQKVSLKANRRDANIGELTQEELDFYNKWHLDFEYRSDIHGHNNTSSSKEYERIFSK